MYFATLTDISTQEFFKTHSGFYRNIESSEQAKYIDTSENMASKGGQSAVNQSATRATEGSVEDPGRVVWIVEIVETLCAIKNVTRGTGCLLPISSFLLLLRTRHIRL